MIIKLLNGWKKIKNQKWMKSLEYFKKQHILFKNLQLLLEIVMSLLGSFFFFEKLSH